MFKGLGALGDMGKMMKAAQEMQTKMTELQEELHTMTVVGESGAGLVKATSTAKGELIGLDIDPSIFNPDEKEVVEDLILAATPVEVLVEPCATVNLVRTRIPASPCKVAVTGVNHIVTVATIEVRAIPRTEEGVMALVPM